MKDCGRPQGSRLSASSTVAVSCTVWPALGAAGLAWMALTTGVAPPQGETSTVTGAETVERPVSSVTFARTT